jgi:hypothetical protein
MDHLRAHFAFMLGLCCYFLGSILAINVHSNALGVAYAAAIWYGTGFGWTFVCLNTTTAHFYGPSAFPTLNGMALLLTGVVCSPAGYIGGKLFDIRGNYKLAFEINMLVAGGGILALFFETMPLPPDLEGA